MASLQAVYFCCSDCWIFGHLHSRATRKALVCPPSIRGGLDNALHLHATVADKQKSLGRNASWIAVHSSRKPAPSRRVRWRPATTRGAGNRAIGAGAQMAHGFELSEEPRHDLWRRGDVRQVRDGSDGRKVQHPVLSGRRAFSGAAGRRQGAGRHRRDGPHGAPTITGARTRPSASAPPFRSA